MVVHEGHRDRMRERVEYGGIECLHDHEVLEYLLYSFIPRKDTNGIAHELVSHFGGLAQVFDASIERLIQIKGISHKMALYLSTQGALARRYISAGIDEKKINVNNLYSIVELMRPILSTLKVEEIHMLLRDSGGKLIKRVKLAEGVVDEAYFNIRNVADIVLRSEACGVVLVHNHPSGEAFPSTADEKITGQICLTLASINVSLDDHVIITADSHYSFNSHGLIKKIKNANIKLDGGIVKDVKY